MSTSKSTSRRRSGPKHPGVTLIKPDPARRIGWRARYRDPDSRKLVKVTLSPLLRTAEARADWAARKSKALLKRRLELEGGAPRATGTSLESAVASYFKDHPQLRPSTRGVYRAAADKFLAWARAASVASGDDLTGPKIVAYRATLVRERKRVPVPGGKRGESKATNEPRAPKTVNVDLRATRTVLGCLRRLGLLPRVSSDELTDALARLPEGSEAIEYLKPAELRRLLDAALRHDAATFTATRDEHAGNAKPGRTPRYPAIAPFIATVLLTGMRRDEARTLDWSQVDLHARDDHGRKVGEIHLAGSGTKTHKARMGVGE